MIYNFLNKWLILYNGTKLLTKGKLSQTSIENELLIMYFLRALNINCTNYDIAKIKDQIYLICPNFLNIGEKILNIFNYPLDIDKLYNTAKNNHFEVHLLKTLFTDRIYGNIDRFPQNFGIILGNHEKQSRICPLYDNGEDECIFYREDNYFPYIEDEKNDSSTIFNYLLGYEEVMHWLNGPGKKANLYDVAERLKREKGFTIRDKTYTKFQNFFKDSQTIINDELKAKGKSFRMNLV